MARTRGCGGIGEHIFDLLVLTYPADYLPRGTNACIVPENTSNACIYYSARWVKLQRIALGEGQTVPCWPCLDEIARLNYRYSLYTVRLPTDSGLQ